jgi:putative ABC transport system substrate-binding protein
LLRSLSERLAANGFADGRDVSIEVGSCELDLALIPDLARRMVASRPDVIFTTHEVWVEALKRETSTIPIVFSFVSEPVERGFVLSLSRSGTNITGVTDRGREIIVKRMELMRDAFPGVRRLLLLADFKHLERSDHEEIEKAAKLLNIVIINADIAGQSVEKALNEARRQNPDSVLPIGTLDVRPGENGVKKLNEFAARRRIPVVYSSSGVVDKGGLMSLDIDRLDNYQRAAEMVVQVLKGARPAAMPVEQAAKFELVINLKTAKTLGLKISQSVLVRANRVIE